MLDSTLAGEDSLLDISIASEDLEDAGWVDCSSELALSAYSHFNDLRLSGSMCDVQLQVEESTFRTHKIVLASTIPYFAKMFTTEMVEAHSDTIKMENIDAETMESILNFVYTGRVKFTSKNMEKLLKAADYLQLIALSNHCSQILKSRITERNVFSIRRSALLYNVPQVLTGTDCFIQRYFVAVSQTEEFAQLDLNTLLQILSWDQLHVDSEERVFEAAVRWLEYDVHNRHIFAPKLLGAVRMPLLRPAFIIDEVSKHPLLRNSMDCRDLIDEAKNYHLIPERRAFYDSRFKATYRMCTDMPGKIYALGGINQLAPAPSAVEWYDPQTKRWDAGTPMRTQRTRIGVAVFDNKIFVIGGYNGAERLRSAEMFDTRTGRWSDLPHMIKRRSAMCAISLGELVFVCGGYDGTNALNSVEYFDLRQNKWSIGVAMIENRCAAAIAIVKGQIYVIGGHNGVHIFNTVERFDPIAQRWEKVAPMQQPRCRLSATTHHGKIYAAGGYNCGTFVATVEVYDPDTNQWVYMAPMNVPRARVSLVTNGDLLYAVGGYDGDNNLNSMEIFHPNQNRWVPAPSMRFHEGGVGCVVVPNILPSSPARRDQHPQQQRSMLKRPMSGRSGEEEGPSGKREGDQLMSSAAADVHMAAAGPSSAPCE